VIIDSHLHLPGLKKGGSFKDSKRMLLEDLKRHRVDYAVLIPDNVPASDVGDLDTVIELTQDEPRLFPMGTLNILKDRESILDKLDWLFESKRIVGIKLFPGHDPIYPTDRRLIPVYELCIKHDLPIMIHTGWNPNNPKAAEYNDPKYIVKIAKIFHNLKIVISHYFWPEVEYCREVTRAFQNIYFDTSGLADEEVIRQTGFQRIHRVLTETFRERPDSVLFGTDYAACDIGKHIELVKSLKISNADKERIFWENALRLFRLRLI